MFGISEALTLITTGINKIWPDATEEQKLKFQLLTSEVNIEAQRNKQQVEINKIEAKSDSFFKSGWRPFVGWICGISLLYVGIIEPILRFILITGFDYSGEFPKIDSDITFQLLLGMLGLAGSRSFDKNKLKIKG